jgi:hypothetical protein
MKQVPADIVELRAEWFRWYKVWSAIHHTVGGFSVIGAVLVASRAECIQQYASLLSVAVAVCTATVTYYQTSAKARAFISAWRLLGKGIDDFLTDELFTEKQLRDVKNRCEFKLIAPKD